MSASPLTSYIQLCRLRRDMEGGIVLEGGIAEIESFIRHMDFSEEESAFNLKKNSKLSRKVLAHKFLRTRHC